MKYYKITCSNGFCGCDEDFYVQAEENEIDDLANDIFQNDYSFYEPDGRFIYGKSWGDDITDDEVEEYQENCEFYYTEISEEEYNEHESEWG